MIIYISIFVYLLFIFYLYITFINTFHFNQEQGKYVLVLVLQDSPMTRTNDDNFKNYPEIHY